MVAPPLTAKPGSLTEEETRAVAEFRQRLHAALPGQIHSLILFGSKARGDAWAESDIDVLVVLGDGSEADVEAVQDLSIQVWNETGLDISALAYREVELARQLDLGTPLMQNIANDGIVLFGEGIVVKQVKKRELTQRYMKSAREHLTAARLLTEHGLWRDAVSTAYYACLDAADAALIAKGITPKSHAGTITHFGLHLVRPGLVPDKHNIWLQRALKFRLQADYEREKVFQQEDAQRAVQRTEELVELIEQLLPSLLAEE